MGGCLGIDEHRCSQNTTQNEVWAETYWTGPMLTLLGHTLTGHFEHSEKINFCPYCGKDLRKVDEDQ